MGKGASTSNSNPISQSPVALLQWGSSGAGPLFLLELARAFSEEGKAVILSYSRRGELAQQLERLPGYKIPVSTFHTKLGALTRAPLAIFCALRFALTLHRLGVRSVIVPMEQIWQAIALPILRLAGIKVTLVVHDARMHPGDANFIEKQTRRAQRISATTIISLSTHVFDLLRGVLGSHKKLVRSFHPVFVSPSRSPRTLSSNKSLVTLGFFGRLSAYKGLNAAVAVTEELRARGYKVRLSAVGSGAEAEIPKVGAPDVVERRWVSDMDIPALLDSFDILLLPYLEASQSGVLAFAASRGLPCVATPVGGLVQQCSELGVGINSKSPAVEDLADAVEQVLNSDSLYQELSIAGIAAREVFTWKRFASDLMEASEGDRVST